MTAEQAMERAYKCHEHAPDALCGVCTNIGMALLQAHLEGTLHGIDTMSEKALARLGPAAEGADHA